MCINPSFASPIAGPVNPWRLMLALKSGQLVESTWALDVLTILLFDDSTVVWFGLQHMPGLLEALLDHFRQCLIQMFGCEFEEIEVGSERKKVALNQDDPNSSTTQSIQSDEVRAKLDRSLQGIDEELEEKRKTPSLSEFTIPDDELLEEPENYTRRTRKGTAVKVEEDSAESCWLFDQKHWDVYQGFESSSFDWQTGRADTSVHIQTHFESKDSVPFYKKVFGETKLQPKSDGDSPACPGDRINPELKQPDPERDSTNSNPVHDTSNTSYFPTEHATSPISKCQTAEDNCVKCEKAADPSSEECSNKEGCSSSEKAEAASPDPTQVQIKTEPMDEDNLHDSSCHAASKEECGEPVADKAIKEEQDQSLESGVKEEMNAVIKTESSEQNVSNAVVHNGRQLDCLKRKWEAMSEDAEAYTHDEPALCVIGEARHEVAKRCVCVSNILRSLSFIPGNDRDMTKHAGMMLLLGKLLLLHHVHPTRNPDECKFDRDVDTESEDLALDDGSKEWWWEALDALRENTLVILANTAGKLHLCNYPEEICLPIIDGMLHWAVCPSAYAQDPMPTMSASSVLSPQRLAIEALCKLCVTDSNVDLVLAAPPYTRTVQFLATLVHLLATDTVDQVMKEFSIVLLSSLVAGDGCAARVVALQHPSISLLLDFIETAEQRAVQILNTHQHLGVLQENPDMMGTSLDMLRRAASILRCMAEVPENRALFIQQQQRLLSLVMSQVLDQKVASQLSDVLFCCSHDS